MITGLCGNAIAQAPQIAQAITRKKTHEALLQRRQAIEASLQAALRANEPIGFVFDLSDVDLHRDFSFVKVPASAKLNDYEPQRVVHYIERIYKAPRPCGRGLIVLGERLTLHPHVQEVHRWLPALFPTWRMRSDEQTSESMRHLFVDAVCPQPERDAPQERDTLLQP